MVISTLYDNCVLTALSSQIYSSTYIIPMSPVKIETSQLETKLRDRRANEDSMTLCTPAEPRSRVFLNADVIDSIMDLVEAPDAFDSPSFDWMFDREKRNLSQLASLCLVSHTWLSPARRHLYRVIPDLHDDNLKKCLQILRTNPDLLCYVRRIYVPDSISASPDVYRLCRQVVETFSSLPRCTVVVRPTLKRGYITPQFAPRLGTLGYLTLYAPGWRLWTWEYAFAQWSQLQDMRFIGNPPHFPSRGERSIITPLLPSLRVLKIYDISWTWPFPPTTANSLHTLVFSHCYTMEERPFIDLLHHHSNSLRRIAITCIHFPDEESTVLNRLGDYAPYLQDIRIHCVRHITPEVFLHLPLSATALSFHFGVPMPAHECLSYVRNHQKISTSSLKSISVRLMFPGNGDAGPDNALRRTEWEGPYMVAKELGIEFYCVARRLTTELWAIGDQNEPVVGWDRIGPASV
jgi:hypothetical protein